MLKVKILGIFVGAFGLFLSILVWRSDALLRTRSLNHWNREVRFQILGISHQMEALAEELESLGQNLLVQKHPIPHGNIKQDSPQQTYPVYMVGVLTLNRSTQKWSWEKRSPDKKNLSQWSEIQFLKDVQRFPPSPKERKLLITQDLEKKNLMALLFPITSLSAPQWGVLVTSPLVLQKILDFQKGGTLNFWVSNSEGQVLAHAHSEYLGQILENASWVKQWNQNNLNNGFGEFKTSKGESITGIYEKAKDFNMYTFAWVPSSVLWTDRVKNILFHLFLGMGFLFMGVGALLFLFRRSSHEEQTTSLLPPRFPTTLPLTTEASSSTLSPLLSKSTIPATFPPLPRETLLPRLIKVLATELTGPASALLAQCQIYRAQEWWNQAPKEIHESLATLEAEGRRIFRFCQKITKLRGEEESYLSLFLEDSSPEKGNPISTTIPLSSPLPNLVRQCLSSLQGKILTQNIHVETELASEDFQMKSQVGDEKILEALESILLNSIESMERQLEKKIIIKIQRRRDSQGDIWADIKIKDSGLGIDPSDLPYVFDPFFSTKSSTNHLGLGLTAARNLLCTQKGEIQIRSKPQEGTLVELRLPLIRESISEPPHQAESPEPPAQALPSSISRVLEDLEMPKDIEFLETEVFSSEPHPESTSESISALSSRPPSPQPLSDSLPPSLSASPPSEKISLPQSSRLKRLSRLNPSETVKVHIRRPGERKNDTQQ